MQGAKIGIISFFSGPVTCSGPGKVARKIPASAPTVICSEHEGLRQELMCAHICSELEFPLQNIVIQWHQQNTLGCVFHSFCDIFNPTKDSYITLDQDLLGIAQFFVIN